MTPTLWAIVAGSTAVMLEYAYRTLPGPFWSYVWFTGPFNVLIGYAVYRLVTSPGVTLLDAFVIWSACTIGLRIAVSVALLGDPVSKGTWAALGLVIAARFVQAGWR